MSGTDTQPVPEDPRFEDALARLEDIVARMESGEMALEDLIANYEKGIALQKICQQHIGKARERIEAIEQQAPDGEGRNSGAGSSEASSAPAGSSARKAKSKRTGGKDEPPPPGAIELF